MRTAAIYLHKQLAGHLSERPGGYDFTYLPGYTGRPISLALPVRAQPYAFATFPPFFDGLLPEGIMLDGLLKAAKLDKHDYMGQLLAVGADLPGAVEAYPEPV